MAVAQTRERDYRSRGEVPQESQTGYPSFEIRPGPKLFENGFDHFAAFCSPGSPVAPERILVPKLAGRQAADPSASKILIGKAAGED